MPKASDKEPRAKSPVFRHIQYSIGNSRPADQNVPPVGDGYRCQEWDDLRLQPHSDLSKTPDSDSPLVHCQSSEQEFVIPAHAGIQSIENWIPASAGMTSNPKIMI
jgi:hypothetical protein